MTPESDRDILIQVKTQVEEIHREVTQPGGRVPKLETKVEKHGDQIAFWKGMIWVIAGLLALIGGALAAHIAIH